MKNRAALQNKLKQTVWQLADIIGPRHLGIPDSIRRTTELIERELTGCGYEILRESYQAEEQTVSNLIVEIPGCRQPERILVVGAHYDTVPTTPGADDNASAVAVLLEIARAMAGKSLSRTLRIVFFPCEESPYFHRGEMGSQHHALRCRSSGEQLIGMLCLEMLGYYTDEPDSQLVPKGIPRWLRWAFPRKGNFLAAVANLSSLSLLIRFRRGFKRKVSFPLFSIALPEAIREIRQSDHSNFWDQKFPALMLTDTSFLRNPHYHQATDTPDTLDYVRMADVTVGICGAVESLCRVIR